MPNMIMPLDDNFEKGMSLFPEINWSEIAREEWIKKEMFERYLKTGEITDEDWEYCEKIDWHTVDELPLREEFVERMKQVAKEKPVPFKSVAELLEMLK